MSVRSLIRPIAVASVAAAGLTAVLGTVLLPIEHGQIRIRETGFFVFDGVLLARGLNVYRALPNFLSEYADLATADASLRFLCETFFANVVMNLVGLAGLTAAAAAVRPAWPWVRKRLTVLAFLAAMFPEIMRVFYGLFALSALDYPVRADWSVAAGAATTGLIGYLWLRATNDEVRAGHWLARTGAVLSLFAIAAGAAGALAQATPPPPASGPNILLISIDTLRADHLSAYGYERKTSPRVDALAKEGVLFRTMLAPSPWTLPSHMSLMTGLDALGHGVYATDRRLSSGVPTIAEALREAGYATAGVVGAGYLNASWGFSRGFDFYDDYTVSKGGHGADHRERTSVRTTQAAERWLSRWSSVGGRRPFFLFVHYWDVHSDYNPPPPFNKAFSAGRENPTEIESLQTQYDGEILYTDGYVGRMIDAVDAASGAAGAAVIVTADHGEEFLEHGRKGHGNTVYEEALHVPFIVRLPSRSHAGTVIDRPVRLIDVAPTVLQLAGVDAERIGDPPDSLYAGRTLLPLIENPEIIEPPRLAFLDLHGKDLLAVRTNDRKFILSAKGEAELYDLENDRAESKNLVHDSIDEAAGFRRLLRGWVDARQSVAADSARPNAEQLDVLRGLGYIQ